MYKFSKFDKYSLENLDKNQIWCNHYELFNDPFECWCIEKTGIPNPEKESGRYKNIISAWGYDPGPGNEEEVFEYCSEFVHKYSMRVKNYIESARFSCFCRRLENLLMWSHYADGLRGFCIEFDREKLLESNSFNAEVYDVVYQQAPPVVDTMIYEVANDQVWYHEMAIEEEEKHVKHKKNYTSDKLLPEYHKALSEARKLLFDLYFKMLCYKPVDWKYEEEIRLIFHSESTNTKGEAFKYPINAIKSVTIGEKAIEKNTQQLLTILDKNKISVPIRRAIRDKSNYSIIINNFEN